MSVDQYLTWWLVRAAVFGARDSPLNPWRDRATTACLRRDPETCGHESCARREAICTLEGWWLSVAGDLGWPVVL